MVIAFILLMTYMGMKKGLVLMVFSFASSIFSLLIAAGLSKSLSVFLMTTPLYTSIQKSVFAMILNDSNINAAQNTTGMIISSAVDKLAIPDFLKPILSQNLSQNISSIVSVQDIANTISASVAVFIVNCVSFMLLLAVARFGLGRLKRLLNKVFKLPLLKQANMLGGAAVGLANGVLILCIASAVCVLFSSATWFSPVIKTINNSTIASFVYNNNLIFQLLPQLSKTMYSG